MNVFRTKFIEEERRVKLEGKHEWIPAKLMDEKLYVLQNNKLIHETELMGEKVSEKEFVRPLIAKIPPSGYNDQYSKVFDTMVRMDGTCQQCRNSTRFEYR